MRDLNADHLQIETYGHGRLTLAALLFCFLFVCSASFMFSLDHSDHHLAYAPHVLPHAAAWATAFALVAVAFALLQFSFGYFVSFYFYAMVFGFIILSWFTDLSYDHQAARISAVIAFAAFLVPATLLLVPVPRPAVSPGTFELLLNVLLIACLLTTAIGIAYNFRIVGLARIYEFRTDLNFPAHVRYATGIVSSSILPFLFAAFVMQRRLARVLLTLALLLLIYPVTLTKMALFSPVWLAWLAVLSRFVETRAVVILSLLLPVLCGVILFALFREQARPYFELVNFRMMTTPASVLNVYNDFFARNDQTGFCQVSLLKGILGCPDRQPIPVTLEQIYGIGYLNASLFATEGVASVGLVLAPVVTFLCGLVIAAGNSASHGLPPRFVLLSSAVLPQILLNVPLTTVLLTHGAALLFLLWYVTPRDALVPMDKSQR